jgi:hypothetical protein
MSNKYSNEIDSYTSTLVLLLEALHDKIPEMASYLSPFHHANICRQFDELEETSKSIEQSPMLPRLRMNRYRELIVKAEELLNVSNLAEEQYGRVTLLYDSARSEYSYFNSNNSQWMFLERKYSLAIGSIQFKYHELFEHIYQSMNKQIIKLKAQLNEEYNKSLSIKEKLISDIKFILSHELTTNVFTSVQIKELQQKHDKLEVSIVKGTEFEGHLNYTRMQIDENMRLLVVRNNQIHILTQLDRYLKEKSKTGMNRFFSVISGKDIMQVDDYDEYYKRSIRAINR